MAGTHEGKEGGREGARVGVREAGRAKSAGKFSDLPFKQVAQDPFFLCLFRRLIVGFLPELGVVLSFPPYSKEVRANSWYLYVREL